MTILYMGATNPLPNLTSSLHVMIQQKEVMCANIIECSWGWGFTPSYVLHARALKIYLSGGYLSCKKDNKVWYFSI